MIMIIKPSNRLQHSPFPLFTTELMTVNPLAAHTGWGPDSLLTQVGMCCYSYLETAHQIFAPPPRRLYLTQLVFFSGNCSDDSKGSRSICWEVGSRRPVKYIYTVYIAVMCKHFFQHVPLSFFLFLPDSHSSANIRMNDGSCTPAWLRHLTYCTCGEVWERGATGNNDRSLICASALCDSSGCYNTAACSEHFLTKIPRSYQGCNTAWQPLKWPVRKAAMTENYLATIWIIG